ncbi:Reticulocyte-binding protein 2 a [Chlorella vulgaris]
MQLSKQLAVAEAFLADCGSVSEPKVERRREQCAAALHVLQGNCLAQMGDLVAVEQEASAAWDSAAQSLKQVLSVMQSTAAPAREGSSHSLSAAFESSTAGDSLPGEVRALDTFLQRHGPTGGWHPDDHAEFERILRACRGNYAHCTQLCQQELGLLHCPLDIEQHASWHRKLQELQLHKRLAVQRWQLRKREEQAALMELQQQQQQQAGRQQEMLQLQEAADEKARQRAALVAWKQGREEQRVQERRQQHAEEQEQQRRERLKLQQRQQENRQLLQQRSSNAPVADGCCGSNHCKGLSGSGAGAGSSPPPSALDPATRHRLQQRSQQLLSHRAEQVQRRSVLAAQQEARVDSLHRRSSSQFAAAAQRDPRRLLQPTAAATMRQMEALAEERTAKDSCFIRHVAKRAVPGWCGGAQLQ